MLGKRTINICVLFTLLNVNLFIEANQDEIDIQKNFEENGIVTDVLAVAPESFLKVTYPNGLEVRGGNELKPVQVKDQPLVEWLAEEDAFYTLIMTDPDAPSRTDPRAREFKHWIVVNIPGSDVGKGDVIAAYVGSGPPKGTGLHRYVFVLFKQPGKLTVDEERVGNNSRNGRPRFRAAQFGSKYNLGKPVAGNFYQAQWDEYVPILHHQLSGNPV